MLIGGAVSAWLPTAPARSTGVHRIGFLGASTASKYSRLVEALRAGLSERGYVEGRNTIIEFRWADGNSHRLPELAAELVNLGIDVLITHGTPGTLAAKAATRTVPIVMAVSGDAVATGLINSIAQPGGNVTGNTFFAPELAAKRLELLRQLVPELKRAAVLMNPTNAVSELVVHKMADTAHKLNIELGQFPATNVSELRSSISEIGANKFDALVVFEDGLTIANAPIIAQLAAQQRLPSAGFADLARLGALIGYGADLPFLFRRAAYFVDMILKGDKPADLPVERPTKFLFVINLGSAKALGITVPPELQGSADTVIE